MLVSYRLYTKSEYGIDRFEPHIQFREAGPNRRFIKTNNSEPPRVWNAPINSNYYWRLVHVDASWIV